MKGRVSAVFSGPDNLGESFSGSFSDRQDEFEFLFLEHYQRVVRLLLRLTGNRGQAEEIANEVFWRLARQPALWLLKNDVGPWLYRTAMNAGIDSLRASAKRARYEDSAVRDASHSPREDSPLDGLLRKESRTRVQQTLNAMKPARARLLLLRSCGSSYKELAESLGVSIGSIGTLLNRSEAEFRKKYLALTVKEKAK